MITKRGFIFTVVTIPVLILVFLATAVNLEIAQSLRVQAVQKQENQNDSQKNGVNDDMHPQKFKITQITDGQWSQGDPSISDGLIAWRDIRITNYGIDENIFAYDINESREFPVALPFNNCYEEFPSVSTNFVAWVSDCGNERKDVWKRDRENDNITNITQHAYHYKESLAASDDLIVWSEFIIGPTIYTVNSDLGVYIANFDRYSLFKMLNDQNTPKTDNNLIAWTERPGSFQDETDIFICEFNVQNSDCQEKQNVTNTPGAEYLGDIDNDRLVWVSNPDGRDYEVYMCIYNRETRDCITRQITDDNIEQSNPAISGNYIVWEDYRHRNADIFVFDIEAGTQVPVDLERHDQVFPDISGKYIVWEDYRNAESDPTNSDIFFAEFQRR